MRRILAISLALAFALGFSSMAFAQDDDADRRVIYKSKTEIDFEDVSVDGELKKPHGAYLLDKRQATFNPLIKLRTDFNPEMYQSVHEIM
jgi:hypothetical protein